MPVSQWILSPRIKSISRFYLPLADFITRMKSTGGFYWPVKQAADYYNVVFNTLKPLKKYCFLSNCEIASTKPTWKSSRFKFPDSLRLKSLREVRPKIWILGWTWTWKHSEASEVWGQCSPGKFWNLGPLNSWKCIRNFAKLMFSVSKNMTLPWLSKI